MRFSTIPVDPEGYAVGQICLWILSGFWGIGRRHEAGRHAQVDACRHWNYIACHVSERIGCCWYHVVVLSLSQNCCRSFGYIRSHKQFFFQMDQQITLHLVRPTYTLYKFKQGTVLPIILWASPMATKFPTISCGNRTCWRRRFLCCPCESSQSWKSRDKPY